MKNKYISLRVFFMILAAVCFAIEIKAQKILSENDKIEIIKIILSNTNLEPENYRTDEKKILFSTDNIPKSFLETFPKQIDGFNTYLLTKDEIYQGFVFNYHKFDQFKVKGKTVFVSFYNLSKHSENGTGYQFRKVKGKWKFRVYNFSLTHID